MCNQSEAYSRDMEITQGLLDVFRKWKELGMDIAGERFVNQDTEALVRMFIKNAKDVLQRELLKGENKNKVKKKKNNKN